MTKLRATSLGLLLAASLISGCNSTYDSSLSNTNNSPYDRNKLCESLSRQLSFYDNPNYYNDHPITEAKLDGIYEQYKANGCDK